MNNYFKYVASVVSGVLFLLVGTTASVVNAQPACPAECKAWADIEIPKGDTLRIVHNTDQEAIATRLNGSDIVLLSFKNTSPSVQLYQSCQTGVGSTNKIGGLTGGQYANCRSYYIGQADELGISVVYD
jgi:hypothetical protein